MRILFVSPGPPLGDLIARAVADGRRLRRHRAVRRALLAAACVGAVALLLWNARHPTGA